MANRITKDITVGDVLKMHPGMEKAFTAGGMQCAGCSSCVSETIEEAAMVHGIPLDVLLARLNAFIDILVD